MAPPRPCTTKSRVPATAIDADARAPRARPASGRRRRRRAARARRVAGGERGQQQRAIRDALRAGQRDRALGARPGREVEVSRGRARAAFIARSRPRARAARRRARAGAAREARAPRAPRARGAREHGFERRAVAGGDHRGDAVELRAIRVDLGERARRGWRARCRATSPASRRRSA